MGLSSSKAKLVQKPGEEPLYAEENKETYLGEPFQTVKPSGPVRSQENPSSLQICRCNHAAIEAADVDKIANFYTNVLGFRELPRPDLGFNGHWLEVGEGNKKLMLHVIEADPSVPRKIHNWKELYNTQEPEAWFIRRACHLAFEVTDFDQAEKTLREHGLEYSRHVLPEVNMKQLFLYDPEGHGIEIGVYEDTKDFFKEQGVEPPT